MRLVEWPAVKDADQLLTNGLLIGFAPAIERNCRHALTSKHAEKAPAVGSIGVPLSTVTY